MVDDTHRDIFTATGQLRFVVLPPEMQPCIPGIRLPTAGIFVDKDGMPCIPARAGTCESEDLYQVLEGFYFSRAAALDHIPNPKGLGRASKRNLLNVRNDIEAAALDKTDDLEKAIADFGRPMLDTMSTRPIPIAAVYRYGRMLRYGTHPFAAYIFSLFGGIQGLERLRVELRITHADERRLRDELLKGDRFKCLPVADPPSVDFVKDMMVSIVSRMPPAIRERM